MLPASPIQRRRARALCPGSRRCRHPARHPASAGPGFYDACMGEQGLADVAAQLYALPFDDFVAARTTAAKDAAAAKEQSLAAEVRSLPKPSVAAWTVNMLAARRPGILRELAGLGHRCAPRNPPSTHRNSAGWGKFGASCWAARSRPPGRSPGSWAGRSAARSRRRWKRRCEPRPRMRGPRLPCSPAACSGGCPPTAWTWWICPVPLHCPVWRFPRRPAGLARPVRPRRLPGRGAAGTRPAAPEPPPGPRRESGGAAPVAGCPAGHRGNPLRPRCSGPRHCSRMRKNPPKRLRRKPGA